MPSLGIPVTTDRHKEINRFQLCLALPDSLYWASGPKASQLQGLADSFASDILNLAVLAGRLLRYAGITAEGYFTRHDILDISVDAEAYFVTLQTACDLMAEVICALGVAKKGQAPSDSFHRFKNWAAEQLTTRNPRIRASYGALVARDLPWFTEINKIRTKLVHRGNNVWIYTRGLGFEWDLDGSDSRPTAGKDLLSSLKTLTLDMLKFSEDVAVLVRDGRRLEDYPRKRIIDGLYVPALNHLLKDYTKPTESADLVLNAQCLMACRGYVEAAFIGYPNSFWWTFIMAMSRAFGRGMTASRVFVRSTGTVSDCRFVFSQNLYHFAILACDIAPDSEEWRDGVTDSAKGLRDYYSTKGLVVVTRRAEGDHAPLLKDTDIPLIVTDDPYVASKRCLELWRIAQPL